MNQVALPRCILLHCGTHDSLLVAQAAPLEFDFRPFFLYRRREQLYRRIDARCEEMVQRGLLQVKPMMSQVFCHAANQVCILHI